MLSTFLTCGSAPVELLMAPLFFWNDEREREREGCWQQRDMTWCVCVRIRSACPLGCFCAWSTQKKESVTQGGRRASMGGQVCHPGALWEPLRFSEAFYVKLSFPPRQTDLHLKPLLSSHTETPLCPRWSLSSDTQTCARAHTPQLFWQWGMFFNLSGAFFFFLIRARVKCQK